MDLKIVDGRDLPAPQPMARVMALLPHLAKEQVIILIHRKEPCGLFPPLIQAGFKVHLWQQSEEKFYVFVWHASEKHLIDPITQFIDTLHL